MVVPPPMDMTCLQNGGPSFTEDCPMWKTIVRSQREMQRQNVAKSVSKCASPHVMMTTFDGQTWQRTVISVAIRSSKRLTCLNKTEETLRKTSEAKGMLLPHQTAHRTLLSPVDAAHHPAHLA